MRVLVSGGAGYIGSHTVLQLIAAGHDVLVVDNFANAKPAVVNRLEALSGRHLPVHAFDLRDADKTEHLFAHEQIDAVIHFAGHKAVGESVEKPLEYYENNLGSTFSLVRAMQRHDVRKLVFCSSATVYGDTTTVPFTEDMPTSATNPYGWTKVMIEQILRDVAVADPTLADRAAALLQPGRRARLRHHRRGPLGHPEQPGAVHRPGGGRAAREAAGLRRRLPHARWHRAARLHPRRGPRRRARRGADELATTDRPVSTWNLGTGTGTSVLEMLAAFSRAVGRDLPYEVVGRRPGDVAASYADPSRAQAELGWTATRTIDDMCADSWRWQQQNPHGYPDA